ncbi:hypothetical protein [Parafrankia sp. FMc2]|uniref:hypothetical protein n=1 Tax=Parafrankia sp. FMc2 TaxID=3233196 RepID=UPI0034D581D7
MVREVISLVNVWCDNAGRHDKDQVAATRTAALAYDGRFVRLDLCDECCDEMASVLGEYAGYGEATPISRAAKIDTAWTEVEKNDAVSASPPPPKRAAARRAPAGSARERRQRETAGAGEVAGDEAGALAVSGSPSP